MPFREFGCTSRCDRRALRHATAKGRREYECGRDYNYGYEYEYEYETGILENSLSKKRESARCSCNHLKDRVLPARLDTRIHEKRRRGAMWRGVARLQNENKRRCAVSAPRRTQNNL